MKKKQSAFSLIEVMVALMVVSIAMVGVSRLLWQSSVVSKRVAEKNALGVWSSQLAESLRSGTFNESYWHNALHRIASDAQLTIVREEKENRCIYTVYIRSAHHEMTLKVSR